MPLFMTFDYSTSLERPKKSSLLAAFYAFLDIQLLSLNIHCCF